MMCRRASSWFYLIAVFLSAVVATQGAVDECDPVAMCEGSDPGTLVRDPLDCHNYYVCLDAGEGNLPLPSDQPASCEKGDYFDGDGCVKEGDTTCANTCRNKNCYAECSDETNVIAYPDDCTKYIVCLPDGEVIPEDCLPETPYFNGVQCTDDPYSCCDICTAYCVNQQYTEVMDPEDCTGYYLCLNDGEYSPDFDTEHFNCEAGQHFDSGLGQCIDDIDGVPCTSLCSNITLSNF